MIKGCERRNTVGPNQACTLFGSSSGSNIIPGRDYLRVGYGLHIADLWRRNFLVLLGMFILFQITQLICIEFYPVCCSLPSASTGLTKILRMQQHMSEMSVNIFAREGSRAKKRRLDLESAAAEGEEKTEKDRGDAISR